MGGYVHFVYKHQLPNRHLLRIYAMGVQITAQTWHLRQGVMGDTPNDNMQTGYTIDRHTGPGRIHRMCAMLRVYTLAVVITISVLQCAGLKNIGY